MYKRQVGKSGAGKTTLLNIIGLITDISEGTITIDSHKNLSMNGKNAMILRRYTIGYLFQNYGLIEDESVLWNLKLALEYKKVKKEEKLKLINKYLKQFELSDMLNKKVYQLSGGEMCIRDRDNSWWSTWITPFSKSISCLVSPHSSEIRSPVFNSITIAS